MLIKCITSSSSSSSKKSSSSSSSKIVTPTTPPPQPSYSPISSSSSCKNPTGTVCIVRDHDSNFSGGSNQIYLRKLNCTAWKRAYMQVWGNKSTRGLQYGGMVVWDGEQDGTRFVTGDTVVFESNLSPTYSSVGLVNTNTPYTVQVIETPYAPNYPGSQFLLIKCASSSSSSIPYSPNNSCFLSNDWVSLTSNITLIIGKVRGLTSGAYRVASAGGWNDNLRFEKKTITGTTIKQYAVFAGLSAAANSIPFIVGETIVITEALGFNGTYKVLSTYAGPLTGTDSKGAILGCI